MIAIGGTKITKAFLGQTELANVAIGDELLLSSEPEVVIMTDVTNPEVLAVCYTQGWAAHADYMTKKEAEKVTSIGTAFQSNTAITHFEDFEYFSSCVSLSNNAFKSCAGLTSITLPTSCKTIGDSSFYNCQSLAAINLSNVETIGNLGMYNCKALTSVDISSCITLNSSVFYNCTNLESVGSVASVVSLGASAFRSTKISGVLTFSSFTVTSIPQYIFNSCPVTGVNLPISQYTSIANNAFQGSGIVSFVIREGCTTANNHSFSTNKMVYIDIPSTFTTWNGFALYGCTSQKVIVCRAAAPPTIGQQVESTSQVGSFYRLPANCKVYVPSASLSAYQSAGGWKAIKDQMLTIEGTWYENNRSLDPND